MAKAVMTKEEKEKKLEIVKSALEKAHGAGVVARLGDKPIEGVDFLSTEIIELDTILGGGFPFGRIIEIYGPESSGKTTIALHAVASAQAKGGKAVYLDVEHACDPVYMAALGVDVENLMFSQPDSGEQALDILEQMVSSGAIDIAIVDSVAALTPIKEIEGDFGDSTMGAQARMMSQACRKLVATVGKTKTIVIFINQIRMKIGVMFGCFSYNTRVCLADGTTEKIGKIVNQKLNVEVLSFNPETCLIEPKKILNYFDNGVTEKFLNFSVKKPYGNGRSQFSCTDNHLIFCKDGEINASDLRVGDFVLGQGKYRLSLTQKEVVKGSLLGDGCVSAPNNHFKIAHSKAQDEYCLYKKSLFSNLNPTQYTHAKGGVAFEIGKAEEFNEYREMCYGKNGKRIISKEFIEGLSDIAIAIWFMDDACLTGSHELWGNGKIVISLMSYSVEDITIIRDTLNAKGYGYGFISKYKRLEFSGEESGKIQSRVAKWIHPSMRYKLAEKFQSIPFESIPLDFMPAYYKLVPREITSIKTSTKRGSKFDLEVEGSHTYLVDGVGVHNSPETTTGGNALKFYASQRLDVRKIETVEGKNDEDATGNKIRIKIIKNKVAPPFRKAEFLIEFGKGINKIDSLVNSAVSLGIVDKKGAWYSYKEEKLGQGSENVKTFLSNNPKIKEEVEAKCRDLLFKKLGNMNPVSPDTPKRKVSKKDDSIAISLSVSEDTTSIKSLAEQALSE